MIKKIMKLFLILALILGFCATYVFATDINLNLPGADINQADNTSNTNTDINQNIENDQNNEDQNIQNDISNEDDNSSILPDQLQPSSINSGTESGLNTTNIINILLITVGVILILLAIAIIIRLK